MEWSRRVFRSTTSVRRTIVWWRSGREPCLFLTRRGGGSIHSAAGVECYLNVGGVVAHYPWREAILAIARRCLRVLTTNILGLRRTVVLEIDVFLSILHNKYRVYVVFGTQIMSLFLSQGAFCFMLAEFLARMCRNGSPKRVMSRHLKDGAKRRSEKSA